MKKGREWWSFPRFDLDIGTNDCFDSEEECREAARILDWPYYYHHIVDHSRDKCTEECNIMHLTETGEIRTIETRKYER